MILSLLFYKGEQISFTIRMKSILSAEGSENLLDDLPIWFYAKQGPFSYNGRFLVQKWLLKPPENESNCLRTVRYTELLKDIRQMIFHRMLANKQRLSNFFVAHSSDQML